MGRPKSRFQLGVHYVVYIEKVVYYSMSQRTKSDDDFCVFVINGRLKGLSMKEPLRGFEFANPKP